MAELSDKDQRDIEALIQNYASALETMDSTVIAPFWEQTEALFYIAEEIAEPMIGWTAVAAYWDANRGFISRLGVSAANVRSHAIAPGLAAVLYALHWEGVIGPECMGGNVLASGILRRSDTGWRFVHYAESALGPLPFLREIYRKAVSPAFLAAVREDAEATKTPGPA